jgi:N-acetylglucosaminyldiphosphoundecaprenol N-acetyl-beta-D-mannosaminyltransferase
MQKESLLDVPVTLGTWPSFVQSILHLTKEEENSSYVCLANVHMVVEANAHDDFKSVLHNADIIAPDGKPLTWALKMLYGIDQPRIAGMDLLPRLLSVAESYQLPVFFYGGTEQMQERTRSFLTEKYPDLILAGFVSPPFRRLTDREEEEHISIINSSGAKLLFVVLGCPKQEKWMARMKGKITTCMVGIGGALPVMIGLQKRAPQWMQNAGLEWFFRLVQEPKRLFKRYLVTNSKFLFLLSRDLVKKRFLN